MPRIEGYASATSFSPGEKIDFFISNEKSFQSFKIKIYRVVDDFLTHEGKGDAIFRLHPPQAYKTGCLWPSSYNLTVPRDWSERSL